MVGERNLVGVFQNCNLAVKLEKHGSSSQTLAKLPDYIQSYLSWVLPFFPKSVSSAILVSSHLQRTCGFNRKRSGITYACTQEHC